MNATRDEFWQLKVLRSAAKQVVFVMKVHSHKTAREDPVHVVMDTVHFCLY